MTSHLVMHQGRHDCGSGKLPLLQVKVYDGVKVDFVSEGANLLRKSSLAHNVK